MKGSVMWEFKTDYMGDSAAAVKRRLTICEVDLTSHESRAKFGYNYLVWPVAVFDEGKDA